MLQAPITTQDYDGHDGPCNHRSGRTRLTWYMPGAVVVPPASAPFFYSLTLRFCQHLSRIGHPEALVRWSRGQDFAMETAAIEPHTQARMAHSVKTGARLVEFAL